MHPQRLTSALLVWLFFPAAFAQVTDPCESPFSRDMARCLAPDWEVAEKDMKEAYARLLTVARKAKPLVDVTQQVRASQTMWLKW